MNSVVYWALNRAKEPSTWAGLGGLAGGLAASAWFAYLAGQISAPAIGRAYQTAAV